MFDNYETTKPRDGVKNVLFYLTLVVTAVAVGTLILEVVFTH